MQCQKYNVSGLNLETAVISGQNNLTSLEKIPCDEGWIFDKTTFPSSVVYDFQLVCGNEYLPNVAQSGYFVGSLIGTFATGLTSDLFGRRKAILLNLALVSIVGIAISFSPNFIIYMVLRFFTAISVQGISSVCYTLGNELVIPSKRIVVMAILLVSSGCGYVTLSGMAKLISTWKMLHLTVAMFVIILLIIACFLVPESPRWLLACDRSSDAEVVLRKMANGNGKQLTEDFTTKVSNTTANLQKANEAKENMKDVIRSRTGIFMGITLSFIWMVMSLTFFGHTLNTSSFGIDPYLSLCFFGAIETPAFFSGMFLTGHLGRKNIVFASFILGGICCCLVPVIALPLWKLLFAVAGKFFVAVTYGTVILWTIEMVPTSMRNRLIGLLAISARVGGIIAPMLLILEDIWHGLPVLVFGLLSFAAGFLCLLLPETTDISLPVTMKDTKELYRTEKDVVKRSEERY
ncbi:Solute carrier family 22 member 13 [Holothuria leucospilota]|uniref:Solute carrier family 22 member 13 n=1 Tax=Holothuria leucospilota TaxID=206669 RepID=A0A9Q0YEB2_HOLLE|nr:Solute carrier family 22 member 13 [Holothuria leucospilota]